MVWGSINLKSCDALIKRIEGNDPSLVDLVILPIKSFGDPEIERLCMAFNSRQNTHLQSIYASGHAISSWTVSKLASSLLHSSVKNISIGNSNFGDEGVAAFCSPLEVYHGGMIQRLDFEYKTVGPLGMEAIGKTFLSSASLVELRLGRNPIADDGLISLAKVASVNAFQCLQLLDLSSCGLGSLGVERLTDILLRRKSYTRMSLKLDDNPLMASSCTSLGRLLSTSHLSSLSIQGCSIGDEGMQILNSSVVMINSSGLSSLNLSDNGFGPIGAKYIALLVATNLFTEIKDLNVSMNMLGAEGVSLISSALHTGPAAQLRLDLTCCGIGIEGAISALNCRSVSALVLFNNSLASEGLTALAPLLRGGHSKVEYLDLGGNMAGADAVYDILTALGQKNDAIVNTLKTIILGGNATDHIVESQVKELALIRPELDIAFDRSDWTRDG